MITVYKIEIIIEGTHALAISATRNELAYDALTKEGAESIDALVRAMCEAGQRVASVDPATESTELVLDDLPYGVLDAEVLDDER